MRILGIDPGSAATGYGIVERDGSRVVHVAHGTLRPPRSAPLAERLAWLQRGLVEVLETHRPQAAVVERIFVNASVRSALVLGQARGVALAAAAATGIPVHELAPQHVKQAVVGTGAADKRQVQAMVRRLLGLERAPASDAADALAAAICQAHAGPLAALVPPPGRGARRRDRAAWVVRRAR